MARYDVTLLSQPPMNPPFIRAQLIFLLAATSAQAMNPADNYAFYNRNPIAKAEQKTLDVAWKKARALATADHYIFRAQRKLDNGDVAGALADYTHAIDLNANDIYSLRGRGYARENTGDMHGAIQDYTRAIQLDPDDAYSFWGRGYAREHAGDNRGAIQDFTRAIAIKPDDPYPYCERGSDEVEIGDFDAALADCNRSIALDPNSTFAWLYRAETNTMLRNWPDAIADFQRTCELDNKTQDYPHLYIWVNRAHESGTDTANKDLGTYLARRTRPEETPPRNRWYLKVCAFLFGKVSEADLFAAAISPDAKDGTGWQCEAFFYAGMKHLFAGDQSTAIDYLHKCLATGQVDYIEYQMATSELKALGQ